jgi:SWI/SNF-related matrix-associated actin-dependent regulator 1 of chromatin subfamily A
MGLGKTTSLTVASIEGNFDAILIICPASLKSNWFNELTNYVAERDISIIGGVNEMKKGEIERYLGYAEGKSGKKLSELQQEAKERGKWTDNRYVIINFDILDDVYKLSKARSKEGLEKALENSPMLKFLLNKKSLIIIDEAHKLSNNTSDRYKIVKDLIKKSNPHSVYLSTGTPITNDPANYFNLLALINDPLTSDREFYYMRYCNAFKMPINEQQKEKKQRISREFVTSHGKQTWYDLDDDEKDELNGIIDKRVIQKIIPKGGKNLEELKLKTAHVYLRRTKADIGDLPPKYIHERVFELDAIQMMEYTRLWEEYEAAKLEEDPSKEINKELIEGGLYRKYLSNQMVPHTIKLAEKCLERGEKIVIACCYDEELYTLRDYFKDKCVIYNGKMSLKEKDEAIKKFNNDENITVFIGNIIAAGVGITLTASRIIIFNNFSYVPGDNQQMQDRVHRIGQTRDVHIFYQFFRDTQYEKMWDTVISKSVVIDQVIKKEDEK